MQALSASKPPGVLRNLYDLTQLLRSGSQTRTIHNYSTPLRTSHPFRPHTHRLFRSPRPNPHSTLRTRPTRTQTRFNSSTPSNTPKSPRPDPTSNLGSPTGINEANLSLSQRFRKLSREYGWSAVGVYLLLSAADFPFCFLAVRLLGTERIGHWEHIVVGWAWRLATLDGRLTQDTTTEYHDEEKLGRRIEGGHGVVAMSQEGGKVLEQANEGQGWTWGVEEAQEANKKEDATIWTQLALAYAIHKSFIFIRIPATVAVTPRVVKTLRGWGWDIGKRPKKSKALSSKDKSTPES